VKGTTRHETRVAAYTSNCLALIPRHRHRPDRARVPSYHHTAVLFLFILFIFISSLLINRLYIDPSPKTMQPTHTRSSVLCCATITNSTKHTIRPSLRVSEGASAVSGPTSLQYYGSRRDNITPLATQSPTAVPFLMKSKHGSTGLQ